MSRRWLTVSLACLLAGTLHTSAAAAPAGPSAPDRPVNRTYENPLAPDAGNEGTVDSCADPAVVRGPSRWFMYCTSDPLNDEDVDAEGNLILRPIPMLVSRNLIDWRYVGDALPEPPSWAADGAGLWAPDVLLGGHRALLPHVHGDRRP